MGTPTIVQCSPRTAYSPCQRSPLFNSAHIKWSLVGERRLIPGYHFGRISTGRCGLPVSGSLRNGDSLPGCCRARSIEFRSPLDAGFCIAAGACSTLVLLGGLASGPLAEKWGRRKFLLVATIPLMTGWLIAGLYKSTTAVLICLLSLGPGTSMAFSCVSVYLLELANTNWVKFTPVVRTSAFFTGVTLTYALGFIFRDDWMKLSIISASIPCTVFVLGIFYLRETAEWLQRVPEAKSAKVFNIYKEFRTTLSQRPDVAKTFCTLNTLIVLRQLTGTAVLILFSVDLLQRVAPGTDPYAVAFVLGLEFLTGCPLGAALADKFGVRRPLVYSSCLMSFIMLVLAKLHRISGLSNDEWPTYTAESLLVCFVLSHAVFYAITEAMQEQVFPPDVRNVCTSMSNFNSSLASGITVVTYPLLIQCWGYSNVFMFYATASVTCAVLTIATVSDVDVHLQKVPKDPPSPRDDHLLHSVVPRSTGDLPKQTNLHLPPVDDANVKVTSSGDS